jgi:hypothetical protein
MGFPQGITSLGTKNPPEEYDSAGNNQLMEADQTGKIKICEKSLKW